MAKGKIVRKISPWSHCSVRADIFVLGPKNWWDLTWLGGAHFSSPTDMEVDLIVV